MFCYGFLQLAGLVIRFLGVFLGFSGVFWGFLGVLLRFSSIFLFANPRNRSPTVGLYDKLAIRYGYTHLELPHDAGTVDILEEGFSGEEAKVTLCEVVVGGGVAAVVVVDVVVDVARLLVPFFGEKRSFDKQLVRRS